MSTLSLRARLTLFYTLVLTLVLCGFGVEVWWVEGRLGVLRLDRDLDGVTATVANVIGAELREQAGVSTAAEEATATVARPGRAVAVFDTRGTTLAASWDGFALHDPPPTLQFGPRTWTAKAATDPWRVHAKTQSFDTAPLILLTAGSLRDVEREQREVLEAMLMAVPIVLLLAGGGGFWLASVGLRPITVMAHQAGVMTSIGMEDLGYADRSDELGQLARAFNGLLARLRAALKTQRQFMADASHEIRTPVSVVRAAAEVALSRERRDESEYRETLAIVVDQTRRLSRLVDHMLVLARADAGGYPLRLVDLYLDEVVAECCRAVHAVSAERGVSIHAGRWPEIPFRGDEDLLRQLVLNIIQNAVQHTGPGSEVVVDVSRDLNLARIRVSDAGPGISAADRERIFDRFVRLDAARAGNGAGLGLPIARWIAEAHSGTLVLEQSGPSGSTFCVTLPVD